jgi:hypothetical protein
MENLNKIKRKVTLEEIGLYLRIIAMDYGTMSNKEYAELVTEHFDVYCTEEDVNNYHQLSIISEDYELESRRHEYGILY